MHGLGIACNGFIAPWVSGSVHHPMIRGIVALLLLGVTRVAPIVTASRSTNRDPLQVLRAE
jgi:hypothetical protein